MKIALMLVGAMVLLAGCEGRNMHYERNSHAMAMCDMPCCKDKNAAMGADMKCDMECCKGAAAKTEAHGEKHEH